MIKACIFDLDGTLANTLDSMAYVANEILRGMGLKEQPTQLFVADKCFDLHRNVAGQHVHADRRTRGQTDLVAKHILQLVPALHAK